MRQLSFLVLTDHSGHSRENSLYSLVSTLNDDARCKMISVASRGDKRNTAFFAGAGTQVQGIRVVTGLNYEADGFLFKAADHEFDPLDYDVIWLRLPHPVDPAFFGYLEELKAKAGGPLIVNDPCGIQETGDKSFLLNFPELTPPVRLTRTVEEAREFAGHFPIVLKPLRAYGGKGIHKIDTPAQLDGINFDDPYLAMKFLKNVDQGDKRILVVNGTILAASLRIPATGDWLCNVAQGGRSEGADIAPEEEAMVAVIAPELLRRGICFCGIDTLVDDDGKRVLSEINTLSIGGFPQAERQTGRPILQETINEFLSYCYDHL
jgi:glutathione synthase